MKPISIVGIILAIAGAVVLARGLTYPKERTVVNVGDLHASVTEHRAVPTWVGVAAVVGGVLLVVAGTKTKN
jgi:H+/gluconate symporter-like permease